MRKVLTLEVWEDETVSDSRKCVSEVVNEAIEHHYCCDGTVDIKIVENVYEHEDDAALIKEREKNKNGVNYSLNEVKNMIRNKRRK